jgi:hypothetical protein
LFLLIILLIASASSSIEEILPNAKPFALSLLTNDNNLVGIKLFSSRNLSLFNKL